MVRPNLGALGRCHEFRLGITGNTWLPHPRLKIRWLALYFLPNCALLKMPSIYDIDLPVILYFFAMLEKRRGVRTMKVNRLEGEIVQRELGDLCRKPSVG